MRVDRSILHKNSQLIISINYINIAPPPGSIMAYTVANSPDGWLLCDGSTYTISSYTGLFNVIGHQFDSYGEEDLSFNVPDYRGAFLRGTGANINVNSVITPGQI
jgi:microcystin-dependent protein